MMCLIIDACVRDHVFSKAPKPCAVPILDWIERRDGMMVYGGKKLCNELFQSADAKRRILAWKRAGRAVQITDRIVEPEISSVISLGGSKSNDHHIIALARLSGARVLFSTDQNLHADFKNLDLVSHPGGRIYQHEDHAHVLEHNSSCKIARAQMRGDLI